MYSISLYFSNRLLARRTQLFGLKAELENNREFQRVQSAEELESARQTVYDEMISFPPLLWVVEGLKIVHSLFFI
jgi:hypothetical protein